MKACGTNISLIHHLQTLQREIKIEKPEQIITIARMFADYDVPELIERLRRLEDLENGKSAS